jgi:stearoyl-CoA desaturase (delta-9 desaturase)
MKIYMKNMVAVATLHVGAIIALFFASKHRVLLAVVVWIVSLCPGIGVGWHRLLTHRGFKTPKWVEYLLTLCGYLALQGSAIWWVAVHRIHHQKTEIPGEDPHTPRDGKWWSHMLWIVCQDPRIRNPILLRKHASELCVDRFHVFFSKFPWLPATVLAVLIWTTSGFVDMLWATFLPITVGLHCTWLVNSGTHLWGSRAFETKDDSRNNWWIALITFGEGWHNNHHFDPANPRHGIRWWQFDPNWLFLIFLRLLGLAWNIRPARKQKTA